jgi:hypothetical protein
VGSCRCPWRGGQEAEIAYQVWKARQVIDRQGSGAVAVKAGEEQGGKGEAKKALLEFVLQHLNGDLFPDLMSMMP